MPVPETSHSPYRSSDPDAPIEVFFGNPALDMGIATVPKILPRYWIYLASDGEKLNEREYALLMQVLLLRESQDFELRVSNIPTQCPDSTVTRSLALLRRMGLVFTQRLYYPPRSGKPPVLRAQRWDLRSLFFNLEQINKTWQMGQRDRLLQWESAGRKGRKPFFVFPADFSLEVTIPVEVALDIVQGVFFPVADKWITRAQMLLSTSSGQPAPSFNTEAPTAQELRDRQPTLQNLRGREDMPTAQDLRGRSPTAQILRDDQLKKEEDEEEGATREKAFAHFTRLKGEADNQPSAKEIAALDKLIADGFMLEQIIAGIEEAFQRPKPPRHFTHCAAITRDLARSQQETRPPESRTQPEARQPEALHRTSETNSNTTDSRSAPEAELIEADLSPAVELYKNTGRETTADLLARFRLMADRCDQAARSKGSTGGEWLTDALTTALGVARPGNLLNYADAVLNDRIANGRPEKRTRPIQKSRSQKRDEPGVHQGIRDYLNKHGGFPNGDPD